jgi:hypothetical protein
MDRQSDTQMTVHGTVIRTKIIVRDGTFIVQSLLQTADFPVVCIWKSDTIKEAERHDYAAITVTGELQEHGGRHWILEPRVSTSTAPSASHAQRVKAPSVTTLAKKAKHKVTAALVIISLLAIFNIGHQAVTARPAGSISLANTAAAQTAVPTNLASTAPGAAIAAPRTAQAAATTADRTLAAASVSPSTATDTPYDCQYLSIPYASTTRTDSTLAAGTSRISTYGVTGSKKVCYPNGRAKAPVTTIIYPATNKVTSVGTYVAATYTNSAGNSVPSQTNSGSPALDGHGPTATCQDGSTSYSQSRSGTCSSHGGVSD